MQTMNVIILFIEFILNRRHLQFYQITCVYMDKQQPKNPNDANYWFPRYCSVWPSASPSENYSACRNFVFHPLDRQAKRLDLPQSAMLVQELRLTKCGRGCFVRNWHQMVRIVLNHP